MKVKVTAVKDGKLSLSIKEATDMMAKEVEEEVIELPGFRGRSNYITWNSFC